MLVGGCLLLTILLAACADSDDTALGSVTTIDVNLGFSLPKNVVGGGETGGTTRMTADIVQRDEDVASFRGLDQIQLLCFSGTPAANAVRLGDIVTLPPMPATSLRGPDATNHVVFPQIKLPVGTSHVAFYASAMNGVSGNMAVASADRMHYGVLETVGLNGSSTSNSDIRFRPVPICTSTNPVGDSRIGQALLNLLNELLNTVGTEVAPDNQWPTTTNETLKDAYRVMSSLTTSSSFNVQTLLDMVYRSLMDINASEPGGQLAGLLRQKIADGCTRLPSTAGDVGTLVLDNRYQGFPEDIGLPSGAARIVWNAAQNRYEFPDVQAYGKSLNIPSLGDYVYPPSLQYLTFSEVVASDEIQSPDYLNYTSWQDVIDNTYANADKMVTDNTKSVAVVRQLQYAVGRLDARVYLETGTFYDAEGKTVDTSKGYTLKGYIIGGQHEVGYDYRPIASTKEYFIYDTDVNHAPQHVRAGHFTDYNHTLGLETPADQNLYLALELVNDGDAFQGADGRIFHGATFYLVADLAPKTGENYSAGTLDRIFRQDYVTQAHITIQEGWPDKDGDGVPDPDLDEQGHPKPLTGLATATYGLPNLQVNELPPVLGLSVDLSWSRGFVFNDIVLE